MADSIGVVILCFDDDADHLRQAVASALQQDVPVQVVVDDGSGRAETLDALASLPDEVTVLSQANGGVSAARNAGIAHLDAVLIQVLDADDWLTSGFVGAGAEVIESGARIAYADMSHEAPRGWLQRTPDTVDLAAMIDTNLIGSVSMFNRADWEAVGGYDEELRIGSEDYEFWVRLLGVGGYAEDSGRTVPPPGA